LLNYPKKTDSPEGMLLSKLESLKHYLNPIIKFHAVAQLYGAMATKLLSPMKAISMRTEIE